MNDDPTPPALPDDPELGELRGRLRGQWKAERRAEEREAIREHWFQRDLLDTVSPPEGSRGPLVAGYFNPELVSEL